MAGFIGIKIANGDFYPILEENSPKRRRLVLTTAHDNQESVQIDLYRSLAKTMLDAQYIGSLTVENIQPSAGGDPSIEMVISCDEEGNVSADAYDLDLSAGSEHYTLNVSLRTMDTINQESHRSGAAGLYVGADGEREERRKFPWLIMGLATLFVVAAITALWFFFLGGKERLQPSEPYAYLPPRQPAISQPERVEIPPSAPPLEQLQPYTPPPVVSPAPVAPPVIQAPTAPPPARPQTVQRTRPVAPVRSYKVPAVIPRNGVVYQIRWGDTLWDISEAFYRNPWLYSRIARYNNISNPDFIIAWRNVRIPPLN